MGKRADKLEDMIVDLGRQGGVVGFVVQALVLGSVGGFYAVGALSMQAGRVIRKTVEFVEQRIRGKDSGETQ